MENKKTICFDFDGVIHWYRKGWQDGSIYDEPVPGIITAINTLKENFKIVVYSTRCSTPEGAKEVEAWLDRHGIEVDEVCGSKPIASVYIDDRGYKFMGDCIGLVDDILNFKTWLE